MGRALVKYLENSSHVDIFLNSADLFPCLNVPRLKGNYEILLSRTYNVRFEEVLTSVGQDVGNSRTVFFSQVLYDQVL